MNDEPDPPNAPPRHVSETDSARLDCPVIDAHVHVYELHADRGPLVIRASRHPFYRGESNLGAGPIRRVLERYPSLRVCVPHLGLFETEAFLDLVDQFDVYLDTAVALDTKTHERIDLRDGDLPLDRLATYGDRIMFGSDYPIRPLPYDEAVRDVPMQVPDQRDDVFHENARRFSICLSEAASYRSTPLVEGLVRSFIGTPHRRHRGWPRLLSTVASRRRFEGRPRHERFPSLDGVGDPELDLVRTAEELLSNLRPVALFGQPFGRATDTDSSDDTALLDYDRRADTPEPPV